MWLRRAAMFALPARYEPFGLSALEAGLAGCALVLGDIPSLREVWHDAAIFVPPDQPEALEATLLDLIADAPRRWSLAYTARVRAQQFTPERMAQGYMTLYRQLMGTPG
jgi:glycosyltransferase involved in cell wall biosynthesis